jgi:hypothetical protein
MYDMAALQTAQAPSNVTELMRVEYQPETDTMFLGAYTQAHPHTGSEWGIVGTEVIIIDHWSTGNRTAKASALLPYNPSSKLFVHSISIAGDYIFARELTESIDIYSTSDASKNATTLTTPTSFGPRGWDDMVEGLQVHKRQNGEYFVVAEDDYLIRQILFRWSP